MGAKKIINSTSCGDWHLGWGYGGHDKVGKLSIESLPDCPVNFIWQGKSQGRHGRSWNPNAKFRFMLVNNSTLRITERKGDCPVYSEIIKSANLLLLSNSLAPLSEDVIIE